MDTGLCRNPDELSGQARQKWEYRSDEVAGQYIVRFRDYKLAQDHEASLLKELNHSAEVKCLRRENAAAKYPTDFLVIELHSEREDNLKVPNPPPHNTQT